MRAVLASCLTTTLVVVALVASGDTAWSHPGGLNAQGCHTNRKTGDYHCHRAPAAGGAVSVPGAGKSPVEAVGAVKKSSSGICHAPGTEYYARTTRFIAYKTLDECLASGGRLPR